MLKEALELSKLAHPVLLRMTTHVCHAREVISSRG
jgi:TPP-dependent indolepyruvate ferredoxin oxidoreductase alpha subunit